MILPAYAKVNLDLRILGTRSDGYHDLKTVFQSLALHDDIIFTPRRGPFVLECNDAKLPTDHRNLVWRSASLLWRMAGRRRGETPRDVAIAIRKRIPQEAGLGGGSADAAVALVGLTRVWELDVDVPTLTRLAASIGADVPFFLAGGTALGLGRGDDIYPLMDLPRTHVVIVKPPFGVPTADAFRWYDDEPRRPARAPRLPLPDLWPEWAMSLRNDLEPVVTRHHPVIGRIKASLLAAGAVVAAMSGSGSAVYGLFERLDAARRTAADLAVPGWKVVCTRTLSRREYGRRIRLTLAPKRARRVS